MKSRYFRISVNASCNLACAFCHNEGQGTISRRDRRGLPVDSIVWVSRIAREEGFEKFKLTGGEPTLRPDLCELVRRLRAEGIDELSMITNGIRLAKLARPLREAGLPRINVSLHTLDEARFCRDFGGEPSQLRRIVAGIDRAIAEGYREMKINLVYGGPHPTEDLRRVLDFAAQRDLVLVLLPELPFGTSLDLEAASLRSLYRLLGRWGIRSERMIEDREGIRKRLILLEGGARVLLRDDELGEKLPYSACLRCFRRSECREGIFPVRLHADGTLHPCLADGLPATPLAEAIERRDASAVRRAMQRITHP
ncbi:MAG: radical SAM protein [Deltaproteobacteria bacterium]|nr:MAG: radical SAM protein [Deltaproteobacteria bacterium]